MIGCSQYFFFIIKLVVLALQFAHDSDVRVDLAELAFNEVVVCILDVEGLFPAIDLKIERARTY